METDDIASLEAEVARLRSGLMAAKKRLEEARIAACGVAVGDIVRGTGRYAGKRYRVCEIDASWSPPWLIANPERKDGTFGTAARNLFGNWERVA